MEYQFKKGKIMLLLTRCPGESVIIGDEIKITLLGVRGNQVRLGIDAPKNISVHREEIYLKILSDKENQNESSNETDSE